MLERPQKYKLKMKTLVVFSAKGKKKTEVNVRLIKYLDNGVNFSGINPRAEAFFYSEDDIVKMI